MNRIVIRDGFYSDYIDTTGIKEVIANFYFEHDKVL